MSTRTRNWLRALSISTSVAAVLLAYFQVGSVSFYVQLGFWKPHDGFLIFNMAFLIAGAILCWCFFLFKGRGAAARLSPGKMIYLLICFSGAVFSCITFMRFEIHRQQGLQPVPITMGTFLQQNMVLISITMALVLATGFWGQMQVIPKDSSGLSWKLAIPAITFIIAVAGAFWSRTAGFTPSITLGYTGTFAGVVMSIWEYRAKAPTGTHDSNSNEGDAPGLRSVLDKPRERREALLMAIPLPVMAFFMILAGLLFDGNELDVGLLAGYLLSQVTVLVFRAIADRKTRKYRDEIFCRGIVSVDLNLFSWLSFLIGAIVLAFWSMGTPGVRALVTNVPSLFLFTALGVGIGIIPTWIIESRGRKAEGEKVNSIKNVRVYSIIALSLAGIATGLVSLNAHFQIQALSDFYTIALISGDTFVDGLYQPAYNQGLLNASLLGTAWGLILAAFHVKVTISGSSRHMGQGAISEIRRFSSMGWAWLLVLPTALIGIVLGRDVLIGGYNDEKRLLEMEEQAEMYDTLLYLILGMAILLAILVVIHYWSSLARERELKSLVKYLTTATNSRTPAALELKENVSTMGGQGS
ncbi:hypothetical protein GF325_07845|nr:hypothetical protein [Candidatus Bathyarchaeota archaeon]